MSTLLEGRHVLTHACCPAMLMGAGVMLAHSTWDLQSVFFRSLRHHFMNDRKKERGQKGQFVKLKFSTSSRVKF